MQDETRGSLRLIGVAFFIFFFGFLLLAAPFWWQQWKVLHTWPAVDAEVIQSDVVPVTVKGKTAYDVFLAFRFKLADRVLDTTYRSNHLAASPERKRAELIDFPSESKCKCSASQEIPPSCAWTPATTCASSPSPQ